MLNELNHLDKDYVEEMLGSFSKATGLYIEGIDTTGKTFLKPRGLEISELCSYIRTTEEGNRKCEKSYKRACMECFKWKEPYFFRCHAGLVMWAVPIIIDNINVGSIVCGQVLLWEADEFFIEELKSFNEGLFDFYTVREKASRLKVISADKSQSVADMLLVVVNYLIKANNNIFLEQKNAILWRDKIRTQIEERKKNNKERKFDYSIYLKRERRLLQYIRTGEKEKIITLLPVIFTDIDILSIHNLYKVKKRVIELVSLISRAIVEGGLDVDISILKLDCFCENIENFKTSEKIFFELNNYILDLIDNVFILSKDNHIGLLKDAREYISNNYKKQIKVEDVASSVAISSSYLSHLFKEELNCTVNDYITRIRIEKSIELMSKRELSVQIISKQVGFKSQSYFTKIFKKYMGVTPVYYRNKFM
ncbi:MAG: PocR ligand-binding domain-containing protein [Peptostreptococcaceae bacterium]